MIFICCFVVHSKCRHSLFRLLGIFQTMATFSTLIFLILYSVHRPPSAVHRQSQNSFNLHLIIRLSVFLEVAANDESIGIRLQNR